MMRPGFRTCSRVSCPPDSPDHSPLEGESNPDQTHHSPLEGESNPQSGFGGGRRAGKSTTAFTRTAFTRLRRSFFAFLLFLPLLIASAPEVEAQTPPSVSISGPASGARTEADTFTFTLTASAATTTGLTVNVGVVPSAGSFLATGEEGDRNVTIAANATTATFDVVMDDDNINEHDGTIDVLVQTQSGEGVFGAYTRGIPGSVTATVLDNDGPAVSLGSATYSVDEGNTAALTVNITPTRNAVTTVNITCTAGTASASEFSCPASVIIPANTASASFNITTTGDTTVEPDETFTVEIMAATDLVDTGTPAEATVTIRSPAVSFDSTTYSVDEGDAVTLTLNMALPQTTTTTVNVACAGSGTNPTTEFTGCPSSVTIPANMGTHTFTVQTTEDTADELAETFTVTLSSPPAGIRIHPHATTTVTVADNDVPVIQAISGAIASRSEGHSSGVLTVGVETVTVTVAEETMVKVEITQTGDFFDEDDLGMKTLTIPVGGQDEDIDIPLVDDDVDEADGSLTITVLAGDGYTVHSSFVSDTITVTDNDDPAISFGAATYSVAEGGTLDIPVNIVRPRSANTVVSITCANGTAGSSDYTCPANVTIPANDASANYTITAPQDTDSESDETFTVTLTAPAGTRAVSPSVATITIEDDDTPAITAGFTATTANVFENAGKVSLPVVLSQARNVATTLTIITVSTSATEHVDYSGGSYRLTLPAGRTRATLDIPIHSDNLAESHEKFSAVLTLAPAGIGYEASSDTVQVTIMELSALTISGGSGVIEGNPAEFTLTVDSTDPAPYIDLPVRVRIHQPASAAFVAQNNLGEKTITIPAGQRTFTYRVPTIDDMEDEEANNILATLHPGAGYTLPALTDTVPVPGSGLDTNDDGMDDYFERRWKGTAAVMVTDNDEPLPTVNLSVPANAITEGDSALTITATRSAANTSGAALVIPIQIQTTGTTASASDYSVASSITIANNASSGTTAFTVTDDTVAGEPDETVVIELGTLPMGTEPGTGDTITITITDNDEPPPGTPTVHLTGSAHTITEGQAALTITATRSEANTSGSVLSIPIQVKTTGTTASASDYTVAGSITIAHNASSGTTSFTVTDDPLDEPDETVVIQLGTLPTGNAPGTPREVAITIADNDVSVVSFSGATYRANEGNPIRVTVNIQPQRSADTEVAITCTPDTATAADYTCPAPVTLAAQTGSVFFDIATLEDTQADNDKTFTVTLTPPAGVTAGTRSSATLTIANAGGRVNPPITDPVTPGPTDPTDPTDPTAPVNAIDSPVIPRISIADASATEGEAVMFTVTVQPAPGVALPLNFRRTDVTTQANDFTASPNGQITLLPGQTSVSFAIPTTDDFIDEEDETFTITLTDPEETAVFTTATATGRIVDNDTAGIRIPAAVRIGQPGDTADYSIRLTSQPTAPVQMALTVRDPTVASLDPGREVLTFTAADWSEPQVVRITAQTDRGMTRLSHTVTSTDPKYHARTQTLIVRLGQDRSPAISSWLSRFTRTHAEHTLDGIAGRLFHPNPPGLQMQLAGQSMTTGAQPERWSFPGEDAPAHSMTGQEALAGAFFSHSEEPDSDGSLWSSWGRGDWSRFDAQEGAIGIEGEVTSATLGMDQRQGPWLAGLALTHSTGEGDYRMDGTNGQLESTQTTFMPYVSRTLNDQARAWAALGWGQGEMTLQASDEAHRTGIESRMLVAGARGVVLQVPERAGLVLSMGSDALWLRTTSRETDMLEATASELSRLRFRLEGAWRREFGPGIVKNRMDIGLRHDAGGAETGFGAELGAGVSWSDANQILQWKLQGRGLLAHEDDGFEEYGASAQLVFDPAPQTMRGLSLTVQRRQGTATGSNGSDLLTPDTLYEEDDRRFSAQMAYGLKAWPRNLLGSPYLRLSGNHSLEETRIGYRVEPGFISGGYTDPPLRLNLDLFTRMQHGQDAQEGDFGAGMELRLRW